MMLPVLTGLVNADNFVRDSKKKWKTSKGNNKNSTIRLCERVMLNVSHTQGHQK